MLYSEIIAPAVETQTNSDTSIWTAKVIVCEFLKRVTGLVWRRSVAVFLRFITFFLISTLAAVVIATLAAT
jgi:hypothetical protein